MASITGLTPSPASATSGPPVAAAATPPPSATNGTTAAAVVPSGAVHTLHQEPFVPGQVVDYEEITVPPLYDAERAKGDIRVRVPKRVMQYRPRARYVGSASIVYLNPEDVQFYEEAATLPNPLLRVWLLINHHGFHKEQGSYVKRRLVEEALLQNISILCVNPDRFDLQVSKGGFEGAVYEGRQLPLPDCVIARVGASVGYFGLAVLRQMESLGVKVFNNTRSIDISRDKLYTHQILAGNGIPIPKTVLGKFPIEYEFIEKHFGYPVILKRTSGSKGDQVWKLDSREELLELEQKVQDKEKPYIFQEYVASTKGRDIRAFTVGQTAVASMMRVAGKGQFKANVHQGGSVKPISLNKPLETMVLKTAALCGLDFAGVDVLLDKDSYKICEVNSSPGFEGLERATGINVAKAVIDYVRSTMEREGKMRQAVTLEDVPIQEDHALMGQELLEQHQQAVAAAAALDNPPPTVGATQSASSPDPAVPASIGAVAPSQDQAGPVTRPAVSAQSGSRMSNDPPVSASKATSASTAAAAPQH